MDTDVIIKVKLLLLSFLVFRVHIKKVIGGRGKT